jgi:hypothetical protein
VRIELLRNFERTVPAELSNEISPDVLIQPFGGLQDDADFPVPNVPGMPNYSGNTRADHPIFDVDASS